MIDNAVIQEDIVTALKADANLVAALGSANNVKESYYPAKQIDYPAVRVHISRQVPITNRGPCDHARLSFSTRVFTEGGSSKQASTIAGLIVALFHGDEGGGKFFQGTGWSTFIRCTGLMGPLRASEVLWTEEAQFSGVVYPA